MGFLIIADWDVNFNPNRTRVKSVEQDAIDLVSKLINDMPTGQEAPNAFYVTDPLVENIYITVDPVEKTITVDSAQEAADKLASAVSLKKSDVDSALQKRLNQGVLWQWNGGATQYNIPLDIATQNFLRTLDAQFVRNKLNPHDGYLQFNGERLLALDGGALPDDAVEEILDFASQWGLKISRISINEKASIDGMDLAQVQAYDASSIDWTVTWDVIDHPDWTDDLVLYIPNT